MASLSRASSSMKKCPSSEEWGRVSLARLETCVSRTTRATRMSRRHASRVVVAPRASASTTPTEALRRIEKAKETKRLDLSGLGLREIPPETYELEGLLELQVSNNNLYNIPESLLERLTTIERLGLAGNRLRALPRSVGGLRALRGVWAHGNCLKELPEELCECESLRNLVVGGNRLRALPENLSRLKSLEELSAPGNQLRALPDLGSLPLLRDIDLHGNAIETLPEDVSGLRALESLSLQGNRLKEIPTSVTTLRRLRALNLAENEIERLPDEISEMMMLTSLWLYSNALRSIPVTMRKMPSLRQVWIEGNDALSGDALDAFVSAMAGHKTLATFGVDQRQSATMQARDRFVTVAETPEGAPAGYFKLVRWNGSDDEDARVDAPVLVVSFGSAPGVPNWGGLLKKLRKTVADGDTYDVLYVCDVERSWYASNDLGVDQDVEFRRWNDALRDACARYRRVLYIGDSMGASASLMFAEHATRVLAFCPQVDLYASSIRPSRSNVWFQRFRRILRAGLEASRADVDVHTGSWAHDTHQASLLPTDKVTHVVHRVDSHRLALALDGEEKLLPIVRDAFTREIAAARGAADDETDADGDSKNVLDAFTPWQSIGLR